MVFPCDGFISLKAEFFPHLAALLECKWQQEECCLLISVSENYFLILHLFITTSMI